MQRQAPNYRVRRDKVSVDAQSLTSALVRPLYSLTKSLIFVKYYERTQHLIENKESVFWEPSKLLKNSVLFLITQQAAEEYGCYVESRRH